MANTSGPLLETYKNTIAAALMGELGVKNTMATPKIVKVVVSTGVGKVARKGGSGNNMDDAKIETIKDNIAAVTGQRPTARLAKKSVSNFKIREGMPVGVSVTLRGARAHDFINRLVNIALPRVRDFRGIPAKFDGNGNYTVGLKDHTVFAEIKPEKVEFTHGMEVTVVTNTSDDDAAKIMLTKMGFPFKKPNSDNN